MDASIVDLTSLSANFPSIPQPEVFRENVVNTLQTLLQDAIYCVAVEGTEGIGKTTVLSQFARRLPRNVISVFISAANKLSFDVDLIRADIGRQAYWAVNGEVLNSSSSDPALLKSTYVALQHKARQLKQTFYFIVDGLEDLPPLERESLKQQLVEILPFGVPQFRFLFSGDDKLYRGILHISLNLKSYPLTEFSLEETKMLLGRHDIQASTLNDLNNLCRGMPGRLMGALRAMNNGIPAEEIVAETSSKWPDLFDLDWRLVDSTNEEQLKVLALLAHDARLHSITDIAEIWEISEGQVRSAILSLSFLKLDPGNQTLQFASTGLRTFCAKQLSGWKKRVQSRLIKRLLAKPDSDESLLELPERLEEAAEYGDLLNVLTPQHILQVLERTQTLSRVDDTVRRGFRSAKRLGRDADLLRFALQQTIISDLATSNVWESEVAALASIRRDSEALALANNAVLREDRLQMLATLARRIWERGDSVPTEVIEQIRLLIERLDYWSLGKRAAEIASSLVCVDPDLATQVLQKSKLATDDDTLDRIFARYTASAVRDLKDEQRRNEALESLTRVKRSSKVHDILEGVRVLSGKMAFQDVLKKADSITSVTSRVTLMQFWCVLNGTSFGAETVAITAINTALAASSITLNAEMLADFSQALSGDGDRNKKLELISLLDGLRATAERLGPSVHYVRFQLSLARAEAHLDNGTSPNRFTEILDYIARIEDLPAKGESYARMLGTLNSLKRKGFQVDKTLADVCSSEMDTVVLTLSDSTADQYLALGGIICGLAADDLDKALDYTKLVNTQERRDDILHDVIDVVLVRSIDQIDATALHQVLQLVHNAPDRDDALLNVMRRFASATKVEPAQLARLLSIISETPHISDSMLACRALVYSLELLAKANDPQYSGLLEKLTEHLKDRWGAIDVGWGRVDAGFGIARDLAPFDQNAAARFVEDTEALKEEWRVAAQPGARTYITCIHLLIRVFCGLLPKRLEADEDLKALAALIDILPSYGERALLWADVSTRAYLAGRSDLGDLIVKRRMYPAFCKIDKKDAFYRMGVLVQMAPALNRGMPSTCAEELGTLEPDDRDYAILGIVRFMLFGRNPLDATETSVDNVETQYETASQIATLAEQLDTDWIIYLVVKYVADAVSSPKSRYSITIPQHQDLARRFHDLASTKLPIARQITHKGYQIATMAQALKIKAGDRSQWIDLIAQAKNISNVSDRAYVLQIIAMTMPKKLSSEREALMKDAQADINAIPWQVDKIERLLGFAENLQGVDTNLCRSLITRTAQMIGTAGEGLDDERRRLVDLAYRVDDDFARDLIKAFDGDEAKHAQSQLRLLQLRRTISNDDKQTDSENLLKQLRSGEVTRLGQMMLRALNAGRVQSFHPNALREYVDLAARYPLRRSSLLLAWYVSNAVTRYSNTDQAAQFLRPMFDACVVGTELAAQISGKSLIRLKSLKNASSELSAGRSLSVTPETKEQAIAILDRWFENNLGDNVKLHDPYFSPEDLVWLQRIRTARPECRITVMTSRKHQPVLGPDEDLEDVYDRAWKKLFDQKPPSVEIAVIGGETTRMSPIHDRWMVSGDVGLRFGTSLNSLGLSKDSEISELSVTDVEQITTEIDQYLNREKVEHKGERLRLARFSL